MRPEDLLARLEAGYAYDPMYGQLCNERDQLKAENAKLRDELDAAKHDLSLFSERIVELGAENAKLRKLVEFLQPKDCEGNALDIADTVHMLRSEYDGDHEWEDVVTELVLTKWGGDRWIVRGSKGEAWACDCAKTGYDEDAYEASDDVEPFSEPTLLEVENAKLRELVQKMMRFFEDGDWCTACECAKECEAQEQYEEDCLMRGVFHDRMRELGVEVDA